MYLSYLSDPPPNLSAEDAEIYERVKERRGAMGLIGLDLTLLHAPKMADGWNSLLAAVRTKNSLPEDLREIAICRPALLNKAWVEWNAHEPLLRKSPGMSEEGIAVVKQLEPKTKQGLSDRQWAVLRFADAMTKDVSVPSHILDEIKSLGFSEQEIVELTVTIGTYNLVTRVMVALDIMEGNSNPPAWFDGSKI